MRDRGGFRPLSARWIVTAALTLSGPAQIGSHESDAGDQTFARTADGKPVLQGSTLAGALRSALADRRAGYRQPESPDVGDLFGSLTTRESPLIVFDSVAETKAEASLRDGVRINPETGIAQDKGKYDRELSLAGVTFPLRFDLLVPTATEETVLLGSLCDALDVLAKGETRLGARRSRGLGACQAAGFRAVRYDLSTASGWEELARSDPKQPIPANAPPADDNPETALKSAGITLTRAGTDQRVGKKMTLTFALTVKHTLLIRSPGACADSADAVHLSEQGKAVLSGTSLTGALRSQARRILNTLGAADVDGKVASLFGDAPKGGQPIGSRLIVSEGTMEQPTVYRQTRVKIDRFTGGTIDGALFDEEPMVGGGFKVNVVVVDPAPDEIGLLLLLARDLIEGALPVGGGANIGRGVLGGTATVTLPDPNAAEFVLGGQTALPDTLVQQLDTDYVSKI